MKAMIFAAGLGTRLRPLTDAKPKALVELRHIPLLEIAIRRLIYHGCRDIIVNIHHFGEQIIHFLEAQNHFGIHIEVSDEREMLLDTGGGLQKASWFLNDAPFILVNADVVTNLNLSALYAWHQKTGALATLAVRNRPSSRSFLFDEMGQLCGWRNSQTGMEKRSRPNVNALTPWSFSGIQVIDPKLFKYFPKERAVFSIIDTYLAASATETILAYPHDGDIWLDVGKPAQIEKAEEVLDQIIV